MLGGLGGLGAGALANLVASQAGSEIDPGVLGLLAGGGVGLGGTAGLIAGAYGGYKGTRSLIGPSPWDRKQSPKKKKTTKPSENEDGRTKAAASLLKLFS